MRGTAPTKLRRCHSLGRSRPPEGKLSLARLPPLAPSVAAASVGSCSNLGSLGRAVPLLEDAPPSLLRFAHVNEGAAGGTKRNA